jgi:hypothetical protein
MASDLSPVDVIKQVPAGISWTAPAKGRPWSTPPKFVKVSDVAQGYIDNLSSSGMMNSILDVIDTEVPLAAMAEAIMLSSVNKGIHTIDAGILVMPVIIEMLKTVAELHGAKYTVFPDELVEGDNIPERVARAAIKKASEEPAKTEEVVTPRVQLSGLMSKKPMENM